MNNTNSHQNEVKSNIPLGVSQYKYSSFACPKLSGRQYYA